MIKALTGPVRLRILLYLDKAQKYITGNISENFPTTRTTIIQYIRGMKNAGLIYAYMNGAKVVCCPDIKKIAALEESLNNFPEKMHFSDDFCCSL